MKYQALFSSKDKSNQLKMSSTAILFGALWVNFEPGLIFTALNFLPVFHVLQLL